MAFKSKIYTSTPTPTTTTMTAAASAPSVMLAGDVSHEDTAGVTAGSSLQDTSARTSTWYCRFCRQDSSKEKLEILCNCKDHNGLIHTSCLEERLSNHDIVRCDVCDFVFERERISQMLQWQNENKHERHNVMFLTLCIFVFNMMYLVAIYILIITMTKSPAMNSLVMFCDVTMCCVVAVGYLYGNYNLYRRVATSWRILYETSPRVKFTKSRRRLAYEEKLFDNQSDNEETGGDEAPFSI